MAPNELTTTVQRSFNRCEGLLNWKE